MSSGTGVLHVYEQRLNLSSSHSTNNNFSNSVYINDIGSNGISIQKNNTYNQQGQNYESIQNSNYELSRYGNNITGGFGNNIDPNTSCYSVANKCMQNQVHNSVQNITQVSTQNITQSSTQYLTQNSAQYPTIFPIQSSNQYLTQDPTQNSSQYSITFPNQNSTQYSITFPNQNSAQYSITFPNQNSTQYSITFPNQNSTQYSITFPNQNSAQYSITFPNQNSTQHPTQYSSQYSAQYSTQNSAYYSTQNPIQYLPQNPIQYSSNPIQYSQNPIQYSPNPIQYSQNPIQYSTQNPIQYPTQYSTQNPIQYPTQYSTQNPIQYPTQYLTQNPTQYSTQYLTPNSMMNSAQNSTQSSIQNSIRESDSRIIDISSDAISLSNTSQPGLLTNSQLYTMQSNNSRLFTSQTVDLTRDDDEHIILSSPSPSPSSSHPPSPSPSSDIEELNVSNSIANNNPDEPHDSTLRRRTFSYSNGRRSSSPVQLTRVEPADVAVISERTVPNARPFSSSVPEVVYSHTRPATPVVEGTDSNSSFVYLPAHPRHYPLLSRSRRNRYPTVNNSNTGNNNNNNSNINLFSALGPLIRRGDSNISYTVSGNMNPNSQLSLFQFHFRSNALNNYGDDYQGDGEDYFDSEYDSSNSMESRYYDSAYSDDSNWSSTSMPGVYHSDDNNSRNSFSMHELSREAFSRLENQPGNSTNPTLDNETLARNNKPRDGFTKDITGNEELVCSFCEWVLGAEVYTIDDTQANGSRIDNQNNDGSKNINGKSKFSDDGLPSSKRRKTNNLKENNRLNVKSNAGDEVQALVYASKCGHLFCGKCAAFMISKPGTGKRSVQCPVETCEQVISGKTNLFALYR